MHKKNCENHNPHGVQCSLLRLLTKVLFIQGLSRLLLRHLLRNEEAQAVEKHCDAGFSYLEQNVGKGFADVIVGQTLFEDYVHVVERDSSVGGDANENHCFQENKLYL